jgi:outer membrane usher protein
MPNWPYDPDKLTLRVDLPLAARGVRTLRVTELDRVRSGVFEKPVAFSTYVNLRTNLDYISQGSNQGLVDPQLFFDGAGRFKDIVAEFEATIITGSGQKNGFSRQGTRLIYDDLPRTMRWTVGDLSSGGRGFQGSTPSGGLSVSRSYAQLQPQRDVRPRGDQSITVLRSSTVEAFVNDRSVRRFRLDPGTYRLTDFPFTEGSNNVRLEIVDDAGKQDTVRFDLFFNRTLLQPGTSEFTGSLGWESAIEDGSITYDTDKPYLSAYYVRGINDRLTAGGNLQISKLGRLLGAESVISTPIGTIAFDVAASDRDDVGSGLAANASFSRLVSSNAAKNQIGATFSVEYRSESFSSIFGLPGTNPFELQFGASLSRSIGESAFVLADVRHSMARGNAADVTTARFRYGQRLTSVDSISFDVDYNKSATRDDIGFRISFTRRFGERGTLRADYDSSAEQYGLAYQTSRGFGVGAYSANADLRSSNGGTQGNAGVNYTANRADIGLNHSLSYSSATSAIEDSRTTLRVGTALAFAGGKLAVSRPISDSFAMVAGHPSLGGATIEIEPREGGFESRSGALGPAIVPALTAFAERQISFDVPNAPAGYDLGAGNIRVLPPLHAGYLAIVGSDYSITVVGKLLDRDGVLLSFVSGRATELANPDRPPITLFTNREGRFGASGLRPGQWRLEMGSDPVSVFILNVPQDTVGVYQAGTIKVVEQ